MEAKYYSETYVDYEQIIRHHMLGNVTLHNLRSYKEQDILAIHASGSLTK
jgi:hypothetical protein